MREVVEYFGELGRAWDEIVTPNTVCRQKKV